MSIAALKAVVWQQTTVLEIGATVVTARANALGQEEAGHFQGQKGDEEGSKGPVPLLFWRGKRFP